MTATTVKKSLAEQVHEIAMYVLYKKDEVPDGKPPKDAVIVKGIIRQFGFHPGRLQEKKPEIKAILDQMPKEFHIQGGGGMTFLNLCMTRDGEHWAEHATMETLVVLGIGVGLASYPMPKELWSALPGGMPYIVFNTEL